MAGIFSSLSSFCILLVFIIVADLSLCTAQNDNSILCTWARFLWVNTLPLLSVLEEIVEGRGGVPSARISAYKVCGPASCQSSDILSAFDDAIADGVDIITISIGESHAQEFDSDVIAIGCFHSMEKGILTLQSAGNEGPVPGSVASVAPLVWSDGSHSVRIPVAVYGGEDEFTTPSSAYN